METESGKSSRPCTIPSHREGFSLQLLSMTSARYHIEEVPFCSYLPEKSYHKHVITFIKCFLYFFWDYHGFSPLFWKCLENTVNVLLLWQLLIPSIKPNWSYSITYLYVGGINFLIFVKYFRKSIRGYIFSSLYCLWLDYIFQ
jgi:hypothetical protein